jgi:hypothetical protein
MDSPETTCEFGDTNQTDDDDTGLWTFGQPRHSLRAGATPAPVRTVQGT